MQVLERQREGNAIAPRREPTPLGAANCRRRNSLGAKLRRPLFRQVHVHQRREQGRIFGGLQADEPQSILEVGEASVSGFVSAEPRASPFGDWVQRRILQQLRRRPFDKGVRRLRRASKRNSSTRRDLPMPGSPTSERKLPLASCRPLPAPAQEVELLLAPDQRSKRAGTEAAAAARAHDAE